MGCDIHLKTFVYSKVEEKYIPMSAVLEDWAYEDSLFRPKWHFVPVIDGGRYYDFFGLMGNRFRSWYPELDCFEGCDFPEWMKGMTIYPLLDGDCHTRRWCYADKLRASLCKYKDALSDPNKWRKSYGVDAKDGISSYLSHRTFAKDNKFLIKYIDDIIHRIDYIKAEMDSILNVVDPEKIVFVTWMDS